MMYVEFMKNFLLADSSEVMGIRLISASRAQERLIPTLQTSCTSNSWKIFFSRIRANWWVLDWFRPPEPKNVSFLPSRHNVRRVHENFLSPIRANWFVLSSFSPPEPKNVWFLLSRYDIRRVHEKLFSRRYERTFRCFTHFWFLSPKTFDSYFLDMMYVEFMKKFFLADSSELLGVRLISTSGAKKRLIATF